MSRLDEYEYRRGPVKRFRRSKKKRAARREEPQLALKLRGGMTARERAVGEPFDDVDILRRCL